MSQEREVILLFYSTSFLRSEGRRITQRLFQWIKMWRRCIYVVVGRGESYCPFFSKGIETNGHDCRRRCLSPRAVLRSVSFRSSVYLFTRGIDKCERREGEREGKFRDSLFASCAGVEDKNGFPILSIFHFLRAIPLRFFCLANLMNRI